MPAALQPGSTAVFTVTPTFSADPFDLDPNRVFTSSSDSENCPVTLDPSDPTKLSVAIPATANPPVDGESVTITWQYHNEDGTSAVVQDTVLLIKPVAADDVTGGSIAQTA